MQKRSPSGPQSGVNPRLVDLRANSSAEAANGFWIGRRDGGKTRLGITNGAEGEAATLAWDGKPGLVEVVYSGNQVWSHRLNGVPDGGGTFPAARSRDFRPKESAFRSARLMPRKKPPPTRFSPAISPS